MELLAVALLGLIVGLSSTSPTYSARTTVDLLIKEDAGSFLFPRPSYEDHALMSRWLVHETTWGVLSTLDRGSGYPIGGVVSHSDGPRCNATGRIFFYVTPMDELTQNVMANPQCSFTVSEQQRRGAGGDLGGPCGGLDPEDPACARATLVGRLLPVPAGDREWAQTAVFSRHPKMADWPAGHKFQFYELHVSEVHLLDWYGGMAIIDGQEYYASEPDPPALRACGC